MQHFKRKQKNCKAQNLTIQKHSKFLARSMLSTNFCNSLVNIKKNKFGASIQTLASIDKVSHKNVCLFADLPSCEHRRNCLREKNKK